jgi:hypothetical protein
MPLVRVKKITSQMCTGWPLKFAYLHSVPEIMHTMSAQQIA